MTHHFLSLFFPRVHTFAALLTAAVILMPSGMQAQQQDDLNAALRQKVVGVGKRYQDSVVLRWAPGNAALWRMAMANGYRIERAEVTGGNVGAFVVLTQQPVKPWTAEQWSAAESSVPPSDTAEQQAILVAGSLSEPSTDPADMPVNDPGQVDAIREARERFEMGFNFAMMVAERSRNAANGLGLRYVDASAVLGKTYRYRISIVGSTKPYTVEPALVDVDPTPRRRPENVQVVEADELDTQVLLKWAEGYGYTMFNIYRSSRGGPFVKLTSQPMITLKSGDASSNSSSYLDTNLTNYVVYTYRVTGINAFAEEETLDTIKAMPRDRTPPQSPSSVRADHVGAKDVVVTWTMIDPIEKDLGGFYVMRDTSIEGAFNPVHSQPLASSVRTFRDTTATLGGTYFYSVMAFDTARNAVKSFPAMVVFADSIPPAAPVLVSGRMDTNGVVRIVVRHPADADVMGYRMLFANDPEHEFTVKRELFNSDSVFKRQDTIVLDTAEVRTLTKAIYYKFIALDYHYNESAESNMLVVPRPDVIPPVAPVIRDYVASDTAVAIDFAPSSSRDVKEHAVVRRRYDPSAAQPAAWDTLAKTGRRDSTIADRNGAIAAKYQYAIVARDSAGLVSPLSNIITVARVDSKVRPAVTNVAAVYDSTTKSVRLTWDYGDLPEKHRFVVYRAVASSLSAYAVVADQRQRVFVDAKGAQRGTVYAVKVECDSGAESKLSEKAVTR
ncbi:MAG: hypothetical protein FGM24_09510 [Candidatus Kapabacteria bacterium]|nr:hypothetical protein [Candidatus Kapabacteria bacterium]